LAEDFVNLALDALFFVTPNWSPLKALKTFADGAKVFQKTKKKNEKEFDIVSGSGAVAKSSMDLLQQKTGKVNSADFLEPNRTVTFWEFDRTITEGVDILLT